jgi:hypothetical protein
MSSHLYYLPGRQVEFRGETHTHTTIGQVDDEWAEAQGYRLVGVYNPREPVECEKCIANYKVWLKESRAQLIVKYDLPANFFDRRD